MCLPADDVGQVVGLVFRAVPLLLAVDGERVVVVLLGDGTCKHWWLNH